MRNGRVVRYWRQISLHFALRFWGPLVVLRSLAAGTAYFVLLSLLLPPSLSLLSTPAVRQR